MVHERNMKYIIDISIWNTNCSNSIEPALWKCILNLPFNIDILFVRISLIPSININSECQLWMAHEIYKGKVLQKFFYTDHKTTKSDESRNFSGIKIYCYSFLYLISVVRFGIFFISKCAFIVFKYIFIRNIILKSPCLLYIVLRKSMLTLT